MSKKTAAVAYLRTSSAANVDKDGEGDKSKQAAIEAFKDSAKRQRAARRKTACDRP
jgi:hypothetical protein